MKLFWGTFLLTFLTFLLSGCSEEDLQFLIQKAQNAPAEVAIDTVVKLVKAESTFRTGNDRYQFDEEEFQKLFLENEYEILVEDHQFYYCYDTEEKELGGVAIPSSFLVIAVDPYGDILAKGTPLFMKKIPELRTLSETEKEPIGFETVLEIFDGECITIPTLGGGSSEFYGRGISSKKIQEALTQIQELSPEEIEAGLKAHPELAQSLQKLEILEEELREEINIPAPKSETPSEPKPTMRLKLTK